MKHETGSNVIDEDDESGFTLLEMLIAVSLLGMIFAALAGSLRFGTEAWRTGAETSSGNEKWRLVHRVLRRQITAALTIADDDKNGQSHAFTGLRDAFSFSAPAPAHGLPPGLYHIGITLKRDGAASAVTLDWRQNAGNLAGSEPLLRRVRDMRISYLGNPGDNGALRWKNEWSEAGEIPRAIRIEFEFMDQTHRQSWLPMILALPSGAE